MDKLIKCRSISETVKYIAQPIAQKLGLELWDVKFVKEGPEWYLRVIIDKEGGVDIQDCEKMSKNLDEPLDHLECIEHSYCLEVSSPGIERELSSDEHLKRYVNSLLTLKFFRPDSNGQKSLSGNLVSFNKDKIVISTQNETVEILRRNISHINLKMLEENY